MANTTNSANMNLPVPQVGIDPGPQYAQDVNNCLTIIDGHNHSPGYGVPVTPDGMSISSDLTFNDNNLTAARSIRLQPQPGVLTNPADLGCLYDVVNDLYFNDGAGNQVRITQNGAVAGTPGSIANLVSPASASYSAFNMTFVWQSDTNTPANMDAASYIFRNLTANSFGLTLAPPNAMGSDFTITLPVLPLSTLPVSITSSGNMSAAQISTAQIANAAVTTTQIASQTIAQSNLALRTVGTTAPSGGVMISASSGNFSSTSGAFLTVVSGTITTTGRPVLLSIQPDGNTTNAAGIFTNDPNTAMNVAFFRDSTQLGLFNIGPTNNSEYIASMTTIDTPPAGTYTYSFQAYRLNGSGTIRVQYVVIAAYEI